MSTPSDDKREENIRTGLVHVSDGKSRPRPARLLLTMESITVQEEVIVPQKIPAKDKNVPHARQERMVQITRQKVGGLGLSIKGGAEHKLPILISKIYKDQAADQTGQLFVGDAIIKVNGEYITACPHDDAVNILRNAGDIVVLTVKHYRAATPFLQKQDHSDTDSSTGDDHPSLHSKKDLDTNCNHENGASERLNGGWQTASGVTDSEDGLSRPSSAAGSHRSRPSSVASDCYDSSNFKKEWVDVVTVPLMLGYVTRYVHGTDKLRPGALEVRGWTRQSGTLSAGAHQPSSGAVSSGVIHAPDAAALSAWLKAISDNIQGLTNLQMKLLNRNYPAGDRIEYMGWVVEGIVAGAAAWHTYSPRFLVLKGTDVMLFHTPPMTATDLAKCPETMKVYQTMFRMVKESETVDWRQHCFLVQSSPSHQLASHPPPRYFSVETRQDLLRIEAAWTAAIVNSVVRLGKKTFTVVYSGKAASLTLDWASGFSLSEGTPGASVIWSYRFSQLRGSSDDGKSKLKLHFQDAETRVIETKELECQILQSLLFCMHAFLTAKVASVDPAFLASIQHSN